MARNKIAEALLLYPASFLYGIGVGIRNMLFSMGWLKSQKFDIPVICVGNIAVGGTGKTPHTEHIIDILKSKYSVGVLSRGYGRKTKGFIHIDKNATPETVGDEPFQMYRKFGDHVLFAVCEKRTEGIRRMREINPELQVIVLDDAFQHQYVKPSLSIVLTEFNRPVFYDRLMPVGRLREPMSALNRCDAVIVTKCPTKLKPIEYRIFADKLNLFPYQQLFFSHFVYGSPKPLFPSAANSNFTVEDLTADDTVLSLTGVANPRPFLSYLRKQKALVKAKTYGDHHDFSAEDFNTILRIYKNLPGKRRFILTTEKDAVKIMNRNDFPAALKPYIFFVPISISIENNESGSFADFIVSHMTKKM
ncbi:MAG: tetraacyldisaccharide 4'-kinase [Muribaculaceae bacterium]